ncbi:MAG: ASKHA domain-containing protein [Candidatus Limnocylindrales bacterium]
MKPADVVHDGHRRALVAGRSLFDEADELAVAVPASCRRTGRCHECVIQVLEGGGAISEPTPAESFLPAGFRLACQAVVERTETDVEFVVLRRRLRILMPSREEDWVAGVGTGVALDPLVRIDGERVRYGEEDLDTFRGHLLGVALDVGTTTVVLELVDLATGRTLRASAFENPQRFGGSDVMSRISYDAEHPGLLRQALRRALNRELQAAYRESGLDRREVYEVVVVGNPTMRDLFFGLDVGPIGRFPFRSVTEAAVREGRADSTAVARLAHELGILVHPRARIWGAPLIACHVGADTAGDLVATGFAAQPGVSLLIDIGTNTEVVVGDGRRILAASCPAGPAFEGGGVRHGMAGADGAIESIARQDGRFVVRTIGGVEPEGICGSGLVDLLAESRRAGLLTVKATIADGGLAIEVVPDRGIDLSRADLSQLAQAKAANASGQRILLRRLGVTPEQVDRVYLAGAFANSLDIGKAIAIGLLAPVPEGRIQRVGNASVRGARRLLLSGSQRGALERLLGSVEHVELEAEPDYFELFVDGLRMEPLWRPERRPALEAP